MAEKKRKITKKDRKIYGENARKGTEKWKRTPTGARNCPSGINVSITYAPKIYPPSIVPRT